MLSLECGKPAIYVDSYESATHTIVGYMIYMWLYIYIIVSTFKYLIQYDKPRYGLSWFGLMDYWFCTLDKCIFKLDINKPTCG